MTRLDLEYGDGMLAIDLPEGADVFVPGETVPDPPALEDPVTATRESIRNPLHMKPIGEMVGPGDSVVIVFPDRVKGGSHPTAHRRVAIPIVIDECLTAGVDESDITLICSNGLHRKNKPEEIRAILGDEVFDRFWDAGQIVNHDSEDPDCLVDLGRDEMGNHVIANRTVIEADLAVQIGHALGNPYGGYSGGYKHCSTGITHWRTIGASHVPHVMHRPDFTPVRSDSLMRRMFDSIGRHMEANMNRPFFTIDAVLDTHMRQIAVFSGGAGEVQAKSWEVADHRTYVPWATRTYDVLVFGMPREFHYGNGHGTNPILIQQAIAANIIRHRRVLSESPVVIAASVCDGFFNDVEFPAYRELHQLLVAGEDVLGDVEAYAPSFTANQEYIDKYRFGFGYHPFHGFSMISCGHIAERECAAVYIIGAEAPEYAESMGMRTADTFAAALADAEELTGPDPAILALPRTFTTAGVHLTMA